MASDFNKKEYARNYRLANRDIILAKKKKYYQGHREDWVEYSRAHREENRVRTRAWKKANKEKVLASAKRYYLKHREELRAKGRAYIETHKEEKEAYYLANKAKIDLYQKEYRGAHKEKVKVYNKTWGEENKERKREMGRKYHMSNAKKIIERVKVWSRVNPDKVKNHSLKRYGITLEEYNTMYDTQKGVCKICSEPSSVQRRLHVDHNHKTGEVRGLLCYHCNLMLGLARDNAETLKKAAQYIENFSKLENTNRIRGIR